jgi:hypothetical protein
VQTTHPVGFQNRLGNIPTANKSMTKESDDQNGDQLISNIYHSNVQRSNRLESGSGSCISDYNSNQFFYGYDQKLLRRRDRKTSVKSLKTDEVISENRSTYGKCILLTQEIQLN